jgi:hypothetical protein
MSVDFFLELYRNRWILAKPRCTGYSVRDIIAIGTLAWTVYKSCNDAPESFGYIATDVASLHPTLKQVEETARAFAQPLH